MANADLDRLNTELKKELTSLIISSAKGLTVKRLRSDYHEFFGQDVPFKKLGYTNLIQYLYSIPNTCRVSGTGEHATVVPVVTEKTKHINEMILKQKAPKSNSRYRPPRRSAGVYNITCEPAPPPQPVRPAIKLPVLNPDSHKIVLPPPHDYVLESRRQPAECNAKPLGRPIVKQGMRPQVMQDVSNTCDSRLSNNGVQKRNCVSIDHARNENYENINGVQNLDVINNVKKETNTRNSTFYEIHKNNNEMFKFDPPSTSSLKSNIKFDHTPSNSSLQQNIKFVHNVDEMYKFDQPSTSSFQPNIKFVHNNSQLYQDSDEDDESDSELLQQLGFSDDEDFNYKSADEEDLATCINTLIVGDDPSCLLEPPPVEEPHVSRVNKKVKEKLQLLIAEYPDGIWCSRLLRLYEEKYHHKLDPCNFGFSSVIQMCDDLPDIFYCIRPNRTDWKLYDRSKPVPDIHTMRDFSEYLQSLSYTQDNNENTEPALPKNIMFTSPIYKYPDEVLHPGEVIKRQWLEKNEKPGEYIELVISEVYDPSKFWIQFKGPTTSDALGKVMDNMQVYYMHHAGTLQMNEFSVRIGLMCAALFMNEFHRAIVIKVFDDQTIKVFYVDYGTVAQVQLRRTCFLHRDFSELPMQAVRARLANIIPKEQNTMWPRAASKLMLNLIMEKDLIGYIHSIDYKQEILDLIVTDTTMPDVDVHINDALVENGFAILGNEAPLCSTSSAVIPNVHLYPAFEELENGIYPSVSDVIMMLKLGHTYETIFHGYFYTSACSSHPHDYSDFNNSRCDSSLDQTLSKSFTVEQKPAFKQPANEEECCDHYPEETNEEFIYQETSEENWAQQAEVVEQGVCLEEAHIEAEEDTERELERANIEKSESAHSSSNEEEGSISPVESEPDSNFSEESTPPEQLATIKNPQNSRSTNPPPGFENVQPQNYNGNQFINMYHRLPTTPLLPDPVIPLNSFAGFPMVQNPLAALQSYPLMNTSLNSSYNLLLSNPLFYNQINQYLLNQQREALLQTVQQVKLVEDIQKFNVQHQFAQMNQGLNRYPQNVNVPNTSQHVNYNQQQRFSQSEKSFEIPRPVKFSEINKTSADNFSSENIDLPSCSLNCEQKCPPDNSDNSYQTTHSDAPFQDIKASISNISEHICDRFVIKLKINDSCIHVLKIDCEFFVVTQEIISNLLKSKLIWKKWMKSVNITADYFPNKLVNIMNYENVYNQVKRYSIPGLNSSNNLGCIVRLTSLNDVADIVEKFGNKHILPELKAGITHVMETPDMWKVLDSSD